MDNVIARSRYPRHSISNSRKKRNVRESGSFREKVALQTLICILILMTALIIKTMNNPVTSFLKEKVSNMLAYNIETQSLYQSIEGLISGITKNKIQDQEDKVDELDPVSKAIPASSGFDMGGQASDPEAESIGLAGVEPQANKSSGLTSNSSSAQNLTSRSQIAGIEISTSKSLFIVPVEGSIGSAYGERIDPFTKKLKIHKGIDIEANHGASIKAALSGEILEAAKEPTLGNYIKLKHDGGVTTVYAHCSQLLVKKGQKVKQGDIIARVGDTGASIGAHLHFEIWKDGKDVNPTSYIKVPVQ